MLKEYTKLDKSLAHEPLSQVEYAAIRLRVPSSGTSWLDKMITAARVLDKQDQLELKMSTWQSNPSILEGRKVA